MTGLFRGTVKINTPKKRWAYGNYCKVQGKHYIILDDAELVPFGVFSRDQYITGFVEVPRESLAAGTGINDKNNKPIYGSFKVDGEMTKGGDIVCSQSEHIYDTTQQKYKVVFQYGMFCAGSWLNPLWSMGGKRIGNKAPIATRLEVIGTQLEAK